MVRDVSTQGVVLALLALLATGSAFLSGVGPTTSLGNFRTALSPLGAVAAPQDDVCVAVAGPLDGFCGLLAEKLRGESPSGPRRIVQVGLDSRALASSGAKVLVTSVDGNEREAEQFLADTFKSLPSSVDCIIHVQPAPVGASRKGASGVPVDKGGIGSFFQNILPSTPESALGSLRQEVKAGDVKVMIIHTGALYGRVDGKEATPFVGGPLAEPVLEDSWTLRSSVAGQGTFLSGTPGASTLRSSIADMVSVYLSSCNSPINSELSLVSVAGPSTSAEQWIEEIKRFQSPDAISLLRMDIDGVSQPDVLTNWLADTWGSAMLREIESSRVRSGERPSRIAKRENNTGVRIIWESVGEQLEIVVSGCLEVKWDSSSVQVERQTSKGGPMVRPLRGEDEVVQSLLGGLNSVAFSRGYLRRPRSDAASTTKESASPAAVATAAAEVAPTSSPESASTESTDNSNALPVSSTTKGRGRRTRKR